MLVIHEIWRGWGQRRRLEMVKTNCKPKRWTIVMNFTLIILQSSLLTLFCIFLDSTGAQNKKVKSYDIPNEKTLAQAVAGQKFNSKSDISDEIKDEKKFKPKKKCKGNSCKYASSDEDHDSRGAREEITMKYTAVNQQKFGKFLNDSVKIKKPLKHHHAEKTSIKNFVKNSSSEQMDESEGETESSSKNRIIKNVIFVKDKLAHLKKQIGDIDSTEFDSEKKNDIKNKNKNYKDHQIYLKSYRTKKINRIQDADDFSEEHQETYKEDHKIKSKLLESGENSYRKSPRNKESKSVLYESKTNQKKPKVTKNTVENDITEPESMERKTESDEVIEKLIESDENIDEEAENTCEKIKEGRAKEDENCNDDDEEEESNLHNKKYKFSIKYAHEKKKVLHNKNDHFVKKIHGMDNKKQRLGEEDDDSDEDEELPKRLHHVTDDED